MRTRMRYLAGIAAGAVAIGTGLVASPAHANDPSTIDWQPCEGTEDDVLCGTVEVPLDWSEPDGETIEIALAKREAGNPDERIGTILMDPGGPGGSGVETVKVMQMLPEETAERFDLVGFDPRGVANSTPVTCSLDLVNEYSSALQPESAEDWDALEAANQALYDDCKARSGDIVDHADNLQTVEDIEAIRQALGEGDLNYLGYSYGSLMGQQYAEAYPDNIRTMVLDGNMDHSITDAWQFVRSEVAPVEATFNQYVEWCETSEDCALYGEDVAALYGDLKDRARAGELIHPETGMPVDFYTLSNLAFATTDPAGWGMVAGTMKALDEGEGATRALQEPVADEEESNGGLYNAAWCGDYGFDVAGYDEWEAIREKLSDKFPNVEYTTYVDHAISCVGSPVENNNPQKRLKFNWNSPVVMIGNFYDPATVYEWNLVAALQSGARLVTYEGYGHTAYRANGPSQCINDAISEYFITEVKPRFATSCDATEQPGMSSTAAITGDAGPDAVGPYIVQ